MKKIFMVLLLVTSVSVAAIYIFIPDVIRSKDLVTVNITQDGFYRSLFNNKDWSKWWPGKVLSATGNNSAINLEYNKCLYSITGNGYSTLLISISNNYLISKTSIIVVPQTVDSLLLIWETAIPTSYNVIKRLQIFFESKKLKTDMNSIFERMQIYFSNPENIYNIKIQYGLVTDSFLVSTFYQSKNYPSTNDIYILINKLKSYITSQNAKETGYPMLNITKQDSLTWLTKVAIPTDKKLESSIKISFKRMLGLGKIVITEIRGGPGAVKNALRQMDNFINDYHFSSPAIPFQALVTNRMQESDTSKWITRIYYPVM